MKTLNFDTFIDWCDQFDGAELLMHAEEIVTVYFGSRVTTSRPQKKRGRQRGR